MKKKLIFFIFVVALVIIGFIILSPEILNICKDSCLTNSVTFGIGQPLFFGMLPVTLLFLGLLFVRDEKIGNLYNIFISYLLISVIVVAFMPLDCDVLDGICITKTTVAMFLGVGFSVFSVFKILKN